MVVIVSYLQEVAVPLLLLKSPQAGALAAAVLTAGARRGGGHGGLEVAAVVSHDDVDGLIKDLIDTAHLLTAALHVLGAHLLGHCHALVHCYGCQALRLQHLDACFLMPQVRLQAHQNQGCVRAEMKDLGIPLLANHISEERSLLAGG